MTRVREALFDDFVNIRALMGRNDMKFKDKSPEEWQYLWKENPVIENGKDSWPIGWVLEDDNGKMILDSDDGFSAGCSWNKAGLDTSNEFWEDP